MRVALQKLPGVEAVDVSLEEGLATVRLEPDNRLSDERIRETIRSHGFTPRDAEVRVAGRVVDHGGRPALALPGQDRMYALVTPSGDPVSPGEVGAEVELEGRLPARDPDAEGLPVLEVRGRTEPGG